MRARSRSIVIRVREEPVAFVDAEAKRLGMPSVDIWDAAIRLYLSLPVEQRNDAARRPRRLSSSAPNAGSSGHHGAAASAKAP